MNIGSWVIRRRGSDVSRAHLVESIVAGDAITRCGRRMEPFTRSVPPHHLEVLETEPADEEKCHGGCA